jgi:putative glutamine amidotransferase
MTTIGFSRATIEYNYQLYIKWLKSIDDKFNCINFYGMNEEDVLTSLKKCDGLVLTGGVDIHPKYYGRAEEEKRCEIDLSRDKLELELIGTALELKLPILAICRGEQILNVSQGGDLIVDIEIDYGKTMNHKSFPGKDAYHSVEIKKTSNLYRACNLNSFNIVTSHHQAVKTLAPCFRATAFAEDGIIEAFEWFEPMGKGYLCAVQWHPEKGDYMNPLSQSIASDFIDAVSRFSER